MEQRKKDNIGMIGLEIHVYLVTREKLFCRCKVVREKGTKPNSYICPVCTAQPGAKPMLPNKSAVEKAVQVAIMLGCKVNEKLTWMRKHYNWPDLPKGYQNTLSGARAFPVGEKGIFYGIKIREMHLEEDPASWEPDTGKVDYNRSGLPLIEIVTEPDFSTSEEVGNWLRKLLHNLQYLKAVASDAGIKADVNINLVNVKFTSPEISKKQLEISGIEIPSNSVTLESEISNRHSRTKGDTINGNVYIKGKTERVEIKNVNSIENIQNAIEYELNRQAREGSVRETRRFDEKEGKTTRMRGKEEQDDYRFIVDPDLLAIRLDKKFIEEMRERVPESPEVKLEKLVKKYKIGKDDAEVLSKNIEIVQFFEEVVEKGKVDAKFALHWITIELLRHLNYNKTTLDKVEIKVKHFVELLNAIKTGKITELQGKEILNKFYPSSFSLEEKGVEGKISDSGELNKICKEVLNREKDVVLRYRAGEVKLLNFLVGEVMKKTDKRADFKVVRELLEEMME